MSNATTIPLPDGSHLAIEHHGREHVTVGHIGASGTLLDSEAVHDLYEKLS